MSAIVVVSGIVEDGKGGILICLRPVNKPFGGMWEFPGGKVEPSDDTLQAALTRELREELGVQTDPYHYYTWRTPELQGKRYDLHYFRCRIISGEPKALASDEIKWVDTGDLLDYNLMPVDTEIAAELIGAL